MILCTKRSTYQQTMTTMLGSQEIYNMDRSIKTQNLYHLVKFTGFKILNLIGLLRRTSDFSIRTQHVQTCRTRFLAKCFEQQQRCSFWCVGFVVLVPMLRQYTQMYWYVGCQIFLLQYFIFVFGLIYLFLRFVGVNRCFVSYWTRQQQ